MKVFSSQAKKILMTMCENKSGVEMMSQIPSSLSLSASTRHPHISITSFNVLADIYSNHKRNEGHPETLLNWQSRLQKTRAMLDQLNSDVMCLQEVEGKTYQENFKSYYEDKGYQCVIQQNNHIVSNLIMFRKSMFELEVDESRSRTMLVGLKPKRCLPLTDELATLQTLKIEDELAEVSSTPINNQKKSNVTRDQTGTVFIGCVHLEGHRSQVVKRMTQMKSLISRIQHYIGKTPIDQVSVFICGDFNCNQASGVCRYLNTGELSPDFIEENEQVTKNRIQQPFKFTSAYKEYETSYMTYFSKDNMDHIDFIFGSDNTEPVYVFGVEQQEELQRERIMPNELFSSDHLPIAAVYRLKDDFALNKREKS